jgi:hypothetical protein
VAGRRKGVCIMVYFLFALLIIFIAVVYFAGLILVKIPIIVIVLSFGGGLIFAAVIKLLFNKINGGGAMNFSDLKDFFVIFVRCSLGIMGIYVLYIV